MNLSMDPCAHLKMQGGCCLLSKDLLHVQDLARAVNAPGMQGPHSQSASNQATPRSQYRHPSTAHASSQAGLQQQQQLQQNRDSGWAVGADRMLGSPSHQPSHVGSMGGLVSTQNRLPQTHNAQQPQSVFSDPRCQQPPEQKPPHASLQDGHAGLQAGMGAGGTANGHGQLPVGSPPPAAPHLIGVPQPTGFQQHPPPFQQQQQQNKRARQAPPLQTLESLDPQRDEMTQFAYQLMQQQQQQQQQQAVGFCCPAPHAQHGGCLQVANVLHNLPPDADPSFTSLHA